MKKFKPLYTFASLWKQFVLFTKNWRRKPTGELVVKDKLECFDNIVDKDGHKRFVEGNITCPIMDGVTFNYAKWSLSGTHLMFVIAFHAEDNAVITNNSFEAQDMPSWIKSKLIPIFRSTYIDLKTFQSRADADLTQQSFSVSLQNDNSYIKINVLTGFTITKACGCRIQFDLIIDNAENE